MPFDMKFQKEPPQLKKIKTLTPIANDRIDNFDYMSVDDVNTLKKEVVNQFKDDISLKKDVWTQVLKQSQKSLTIILNFVSSFSYAYFATFMQYMVETQV